ncbi:hydrocephalus-inducing protein-like [Pieris rapae]|uniref:hydrocephalus-inducing protein-like n=1 Tax=Pieris rapae TaxID=64459 RepID=UPI001E27F869|nr:hydrocephalus-inducing protein-like [Pieris rapae]
MELLQKFKQNGYFTADLYHLIAQKKLVGHSEEIIPSDYIREMKMSTLERLQSLHAIQIDNYVISGSKSNKIVLSFSPKVIVFQNFKPNDKIVAKFSVKNISKAPTFLNMVFKESSYFFIKPCGHQLLSRLAPGISATFAITFQPAQYEDYTHRVTFYTDVDHPFSVQPKSAYLNPSQKVDVRIAMMTMRLGDINSTLNVIFESGENFKINLLGHTYTVSVELEKQVVRFFDTFNTLVRQQTFKITNKSDHILSYMCMKNDCVYYDFEEKVKLASVFYNLKDLESGKCEKLVYYDVLSSDEHERVYTRIFYDEIQALVADESLQYQDKHFSITPIYGKLWPKKSTEITITFSPKEIGEFSTIAYLDIDGVIDRVPLKIVGTSLPPSINLNLETLDMDCVYINKKYDYEIVSINRGHINGVIVYKDVPPLFGSKITCTPIMHCLRPGEKDIFVISFCNSNQGPFFEEINFAIRDTDVVLKVYLKGVVIYPSLMFSIPCLDFGMVSLGVPKTMELEVINESIVDVNANVKISSDGPEISSITLDDYAVTNKPKPTVPQWPREFNIAPQKVTIGPESRVSLKITLTANLIRANQTSLELELDKSDSPPITLPVTFNAMVPAITPASDINLRACFLDFPYKCDIVITANEFWGYFTLEEPEESSTLEVEVGIKEGMIKPNSTLCLPVIIKTNVLGMQEQSICVNLFGLSTPVQICRINGCGVRPIVTCTPIALHWGQVKLLTRTQKTLTLCNDSPVVVNFRASLLNRDGRWQIHPTEGFIEPEGETDLTLTLYLIDADSYTNKAVIQLERVKDILIPLSATGVGTSILVGEFRDRVVLGRHFTKIPLNCQVVMENCGTRMHALEWSEYYKAPKTKQHSVAFYNLEPKSFKVAAGEKLELTITGLSNKVTTIKEMWYLVGSVEGINKKELLLECQIIAEFVDPRIEISSNIIDFQYDYGPYSEFYKLTDIVTIKNVSKLPLDFDISVKPPFAIIHKQTTYKILPEEENLCGCICYTESDLNVLKMTDSDPYQCKIFIDYLTLKPVDPLRNEPLHFFQDINKIKLAFNLTHVVEERLEDQEVMKIQILFDTTKHLTLKSRVYCDLLRVKFKGHKNKDVIKLIGKINFPNVLILTPRIDFQCVLNGSIESKIIKIQNVTPLLVCYQFNWKKYCIVETKLPDRSADTVYKSSIETEASGGGELHEILACRTPVGSTVDNIGKEIIEKSLISTTQTEMPIETISVLNEDITQDKMFKKYTTMKTITPMITADYESDFEWIYKFSKKDKSLNICINDVLQLTPHRGLLKPNEVEFIHVIFRPKVNMNIRATLECEVLGGPAESILVTGQSSDLIYKLNTGKINFKIRSFHENAFEQLILTNVSQLPLEYKTYLNEPKWENDLYGTILNVIPDGRVLEPEEFISVNIEVRPGAMGYFGSTFVLEVGHLPFIPIEVFGWGVIPQVYISLPRPDIAKLSPEIGYQAIPTLTEEYLEAINEIFMNRMAEHLNSPFTEKCFEDPMFTKDWFICSTWDGYPSSMDIELAIERMLLINYIKLRPDILNVYSTTSKMIPIPGFQTTPYVIDYGVVITGSCIHCCVDIINYGPIVIKLHFAKGTQVPIWLGLKLCGKLNPGESGKLEATFSPTSNDFTELEQNVETSFNIDVPYGVTIPIQIKALCAVPYLMSNVKAIDFGTVRCGDKVVSSIPLKNIGKPTCIWYVTLKSKTPGPNPMTVLDSSGKFEPGEGGWLSIAFKPIMELPYEGLLIFKFHMNPNRMTIPVSGQGIVPQVHIIGPNVCFPPTLPWAETTDIYFGLTNPCPFPIELIVAHSDVKSKTTKGPVSKTTTRDNLSPKKARTETEIINDIIGYLKESKVDPLKECIAAYDAISTADDQADNHAKGILIFFHGSPCEGDLQFVLTDSDKLNCVVLEINCQEMAYSTGKALGIPTVNVDMCVVEALCTSTCNAKVVILNAINEMFDVIHRFKGDDEKQTESEDIFKETDDEFDIIWKKIEFLANSKNIATPRSKASDKKKKRSSTSSITSHSAVGAMGSTTMFQMDLTTELLTDFFKHPKFNRGFIVETLTSIVFKSPPLTLTSIIKCKRNIWNIHLVLCQSDFTKWAQSYEETQREHEQVDENVSKIYDETEIENIINSFENMDENEFENANPEHKSIYITYGLEDRRRQYYEKQGNPGDYVKLEKGARDRSKSLLVVDNESKKKMKKEDAKAKLTSEYLLMSTKYNEYTKNTYDNLVNIANNWIIEEGEVGFPLYGFSGQIVGSSHKKMKKKSEIQLQVTSSQTSTSEIPSMSIDKTSEDNQEEMYPLPLHSVKCTLERDRRIVLEPGDLVRCKYSFSPQYEGNYAVKRFVEVNGWPASRIDINVSAICDLPRLDSRPKKMFENFVRRSVEDKVYKVTYIDDQKLFEFGPIFIGFNRIYEEQYSIELRNSSLITADVIVEFLEDTSVFQIDKTFVNLEPGCREKVTVSAAPADLGIHTSVLLFCVKDNPEIVTVKIACNGVVPVVEILPLTKSIEYGRHLLYRKEDDRFIVKNDSILPIMWQIHNPQDFVEDFIIAQTSGIVPRQDNQVVPVTYIACRVGVISHKPLTVDIYDAEGRGNPMIVDALYLSAECYDVMVECAYENPSENFLNYGNVKVNSTVVQEMYLLNRGKYNIFYKLKKVKNFPEPSLLRSFEAIPECGVIPPTVKLINIEFECTPTTSMNLVNTPAYICSLLDGSKNQVVVAKFPVCVTIASFYNTFTLFPLGELNFHIIPVGSGVMREVILNNTSKCPITYEIILPQQYQLDPDAQPTAKLKDNKIKNPPLKCGNFFIMNDDNLLAPGTSRTLQIQFMATAARTFEETIKFIISDTCPAEACGVPLRLVGTGAMPTLDFWNIETTFREHLIVKCLSDYKVPEQYRAVLEIKLKLLDNQEKSFKVCLIGDGVIPRMRLLHPQLRHHRIALLQFPVTCLGSISKQQIRFKNISSVKSKVKADVFCPHKEERPIFWINSNFSNFDMDYDAKDEMASSLTLTLCPKEVCTINIHFNPIRKGRVSCDVKLTIFENPYEFFVVLCEAEAFMEDVIIVGLEMLSMELDLDAFKSADGTMSTASTSDTRKKSKSAAVPKKSKMEIKKSKRISQASVKHSDTTSSIEHSLQKYLLDFEGCELFAIKKRTVIMVNNSEKLYRFSWEESELVVVKPSVGYISPGEEKDLEIIFFSPKPIVLKKEFLYVTLMGVIDDSLTMDIKGSTWDNRQTVTAFDHDEYVGVNERYQAVIDEQFHISPENALDIIQMVVVYSATAEYTKYSCDLKEELNMNDTFIYQTRTVNFKVRNTSKVPMKILWNFVIDDEFPSRIDKVKTAVKPSQNDEKDIVEASQITLFSEKSSRESVDTWFEVDLPFAIQPPKQCLKPNQSCAFKITFAPLDAFSYKVRLKSFIENLDPYDQNISCKISAKSLVPYVHLDIEESDYLTSGKRKGAIALPPHVTVLEFNVLGSGCYKKAFNVINPSNEGYEFIFEMVISEKPELVPVHCNKLKGFVDGGTSTEVEFTFAPTAPGIYESQWKFLIPVHSIVMNLLVVGIVREPDVLFLPTILLIRNSLVGFTSENVVVLKNNENESLNYEFKGNSLCNESGKTPVVVEPEMGVLRARSATEIRIVYTPIQDGPLSFKIFCNVQYLTKVLTLCVNALSQSIKPKILYYLIGNEHVLNSDAITNIHLDQTASTYQRTIPFTIKNDGSATFFFEWQYTCSAVKKYLQVSVEPHSGHVKPGGEVDCTVYFTLKQVPVQSFPMTLSISDGPEYSILLHAEISKPTYHFSCMDFDFGKCIVNAPDATYKKNIAFENEDTSPIILDLNFSNIPELFVYYHEETHIEPGRRIKISIFFRPKQVKLYEFKLHFWVNSLCEEIVTIKGEGVPLLYDLYEGCQKSFDLGAVKVGDKIVRQIEVMNHSKVPIDASFIFKDIYGVTDDDTKSEGTSVCLSPSTVLPPNPEGELSRGKMLQQFKDEKIHEQINMDVQNALSSLKVIPNKCTIKPHRKVPIKIQFKPIGMISKLNVQLNMKVFHFERPLVRLSGCATGMSLCFSQNSLQFGRVRKRGCKILKVMLQNKGDFGARFWWQPLKSDEFQISPSQGTVAARTNVTFTITFRPVKHNPFIKVWASCNIENYPPLELALYATCVDIGNIQNKSLYLECPVREVQTEYVIVTNPSDDMWLVLSEISGGPFETLKEFQVEPNSTFEIPVYFKPKSIGKHESQVLYSPLGESALFVTLIGAATHPNPNGTINITVSAKEFHTEELFVYNITEFPEEYLVSTEIVKIIPDKFEGHYEIKYPDTIKVWGEAAATCRWTIVCYEECEIQVKVIFVNVKTREYQFYNIIVTVNPSKIVDTLTFVCRARESVQMEISVKNPLSTDAEFQIRSDKLHCSDKLMVPKNSSAVLLMTYSPLVVGESEDFLEVSNNLVGSYIYGVVLKCLPAKEKCLEFSTPLGTSIPLRLRVQNKTDAKTEFFATVSHPSILLEREYTLSPFEKGKFNAIFEPTEMGVQHCKVSFNSAVAGEFVFKIKGTATTPKPQGPFEIKAGGFTMISFKNVFQDTRMFKINVDREEFYVKTLYEPIKSKKDIKFPVYLNENVSGEYPTGCLTIETYEPADPKVQWTFFLQGVP